MKSEKIVDIVVWFLIASVGIFAAYVSFGILESTASGELSNYSVGGAIAGALVSWSVLTSVYLQVRGSTNELQKLRDRTEELQHKLIRGAPRPQGFETEIAERQRIVLAVPKDWRPRGGTIFDLELPASIMKEGDSFPATFRGYFVPIEKGETPLREKYYASELLSIKQAVDSKYSTVESYSSEIIRIGGELSSVESLKIIAKQFVRVEIGPSPDTGKTERVWWVVSRDEFRGEITGIYPKLVFVGKPRNIQVWGSWFRKGCIFYVNEKKREANIISENEAELTLIDEDVVNPTTLEIVLENPGTNGMRSNSIKLTVEQGIKNDSVDLIQDNIDMPEIKQADINNSEKNSGTKSAPETLEKQLTETSSDTATQEQKKDQDKKVVYQFISRMRVVCYHEQLEMIYFFDFWDDADDFVNSSKIFNQVISSTRFLD